MHRRNVLAGLGLGLSVPLAPLALAQAAQASGRRLILVELSGANDGLNTLVPFGDDRYFSLRPRIALDSSSLVSLNDWQGLNGELRPLANSLDDGDLAIVQGLGYPGQNRSHFKSIALWETGGDGMQAGRTGWLTDDLLTLDGQSFDAHGISLDGGMGIFSASDGTWISLTSLSQLAGLAETTFAFEQTGTGATNAALGLLLQRANDLDTAMSRIKNKMARTRNTPSAQIYGGALGRQMGLALELVAHEINTPVLKVQLSGFDTHEYQLGNHENLMRDLGQSLAGLRRGLKQLGQWDNTVVMTYSEFGRRAEENNSEGTDHGTAAPHFVMGGRVTGGLWGDHPRLDRLDDGDMRHTMDYRALYEAVLSDWFGLPGNRFDGHKDPRLVGLFV